MKYILLIITLFSSFLSFSQGSYVPLNYETYRMVDRFDIRYNKILPIPHSSVKPYNRVHVAKFAEKMYYSNIELSKADIANLKFLMNLS